MFLKLFNKTEKKGTLQKSFYETSITLIPKVNKDTHKQEKKEKSTENCSLIFLIKIDTKILNKNTCMLNSKDIKKIVNHD
jgi:hypothetical protein